MKGSVRGLLVLVLVVVAVVVAVSAPARAGDADDDKGKTTYKSWTKEKFCARKIAVVINTSTVLRLHAVEACKSALKKGIGGLFFQIESGTKEAFYSPSVHLFAVKATDGEFKKSVAAFQTYASLDWVAEFLDDAASPGFDDARWSRLVRLASLQRKDLWSHLRKEKEPIEGTDQKIHSVSAHTRDSAFNDAWGVITVGLQITPEAVDGKNGTVRFRLRPSSFKKSVVWRDVHYSSPDANARMALGFTVVTRGVVEPGETKDQGDGYSPQRVMTVAAGEGEDDGGFLAFAEQGYDADGNGPYAVVVSESEIPTRNDSDWRKKHEEHFTARRIWVSIPTGRPSSFLYDPEIGVGSYDGVSSLVAAAPSSRALFALVALVSFVVASLA
jgi:hypothetical protein